MLNAKVIRKQLIKQWPKKLDDVNRVFLPSAGVIVTGEAKRLVPVDQGVLRGSLNYEVKSEIVEVGTNINYAAHVEYGHKTRSLIGPQKPAAFSITSGIGKVAAQPYLRPALDNNRNKLVKLWLDIFRRVYG